MTVSFPPSSRKRDACFLTRPLKGPALACLQGASICEYALELVPERHIVCLPCHPAHACARVRAQVVNDRPELFVVDIAQDNKHARVFDQTARVGLFVVGG